MFPPMIEGLSFPTTGWTITGPEITKEHKTWIMTQVHQPTLRIVLQNHFTKRQWKENQTPFVQLEMEQASSYKNDQGVWITSISTKMLLRELCPLGMIESVFAWALDAFHDLNGYNGQRDVQTLWAMLSYWQLRYERQVYVDLEKGHLQLYRPNITLPLPFSAAFHRRLKTILSYGENNEVPVEWKNLLKGLTSLHQKMDFMAQCEALMEAQNIPLTLEVLERAHAA